MVSGLFSGIREWNDRISYHSCLILALVCCTIPSDVGFPFICGWPRPGFAEVYAPPPSQLQSTDTGATPKRDVKLIGKLVAMQWNGSSLQDSQSFDLLTCIAANHEGEIVCSIYQNYLSKCFFWSRRTLWERCFHGAYFAKHLICPISNTCCPEKYLQCLAQWTYYKNINIICTAAIQKSNTSGGTATRFWKNPQQVFRNSKEGKDITTSPCLSLPQIACSALRGDMVLRDVPTTVKVGGEHGSLGICLLFVTKQLPGIVSRPGGETQRGKPVGEGRVLLRWLFTRRREHQQPRETSSLWGILNKISSCCRTRHIHDPSERSWIWLIWV